MSVSKRFMNVALRVILASLLVSSVLSSTALAQSEAVTLPGLKGPVDVLTPATGVPSVVATNEFDMALVQGYLHARDRFWQMDKDRRTASGTLSELVGASALPTDIQLRTLGLRRAAWASYASVPGHVRAQLRGYAAGVNAWLAEGNLPPEYGALELTQAERWDPVDSVAISKLIAFGLSFDLDDIDRTIDLLTYQGIGAAAGFDGVALFFEDTYRSQPADDTVSIPGFLGSIGGIGKSDASFDPDPGLTLKAPQLSEPHFNLAKRFMDRVDSDPVVQDVLNFGEQFKGSNWWLASPSVTDTGAALLASDPHLSLDVPSVWYTMHLNATNDTGTSYNASGQTFPGVPGMVLGCNSWLCWGATVHPMDTTDVYSEQFAANAIGLPTHTIYQGEREPLITIFQTYFANQLDGVADNLTQIPVGLDAGGATLVVPRRNNGPIVDIDLVNLAGISVQYTGWGATQELVAFDGYARSQDVFEFRDAVQFFDVGSQNWGVADTLGNIAYFTSAENPIREDLQTLMAPDGGVLPIFIRDGTGALMHEWMPVTNPQPQQSLGYEIMPYDEMPQIVNPASGYIVNANNDPIGTTLDNNAFNQVRPGGGLYYLNAGYADYRVGRIDRLMQDAVGNGPVTADHFKAFQANNQLLDAELVMPHFMNAWANAQDPAAWPGIQQFLLDPQMQQVFALWATWDYSTPTGITEGYDPGDNPFALADPEQAEIDASVAATVWALSRSRAIANTVDGVVSAIFEGAGLPVSLPPSGLAYNSLKNLLDNFETNQGFGASGLPFFNVPQAPDPAAARDFILLFSMREALDLLASDEFAPAFANSTDIMDYRWGKLHRIKFDHLLNDVFSLPNGLYGLTTVEGLEGVARSGGYAVLDASSHSARADGLNEFMFGSGPSRRFVGQMFPDPIGPVAEDVIAGGQSGVLGSPLYANQLYLWLVNAQLPQFLDPAVVSAIAEGTQQFVPLQ